MYIYFFLFWTIFFLMLPANNKNPIYKKIAFIVVEIIIIFIIGFRNINIGIFDTANVYIPEFRKIQSMSIGHVFQNFKDPVFYTIAKLISIITKSEPIWLTICAAMYIIPLFRLIYKESKYPLLSIMMFISLNYFGMAFYGVRHCIAMGIITLSYYPLKEKNILKFIVIVSIASLFHVSSLIVLIAYPIVHNFKSNTSLRFIKSCICIFIIFVSSNFFGKQIISFVLNLVVNKIGLTRFTIYAQEGFSSLNNNIFFINYFMYVFMGYVLNHNIDWNSTDGKRIQVLLNLQLIGTIVSSFMGALGECYRLSMFFSIYSIILLPETIKVMKKQNKSVIFWGCYIILIVYFFISSAENNNIIPYQFFWE